ncbi:hypothetical protein K8R42_03165 [bacterium]|nr:hypothetical protein [bacterium]
MVIIAEYPRFSDFAEEMKSFEGDKKKIEDILNQEILIIDFKVKDSKHHRDSQYVTVQFKIDSKTFIMFNGSRVLAEQLDKYRDNIPFLATIKKIDKYYTFS